MLHPRGRFKLEPGLTLDDDSSDEDDGHPLHTPVLNGGEASSGATPLDELSAPNGIGGLKLSLAPHQHAAAHSSADAAAHAVAARAADPHPSAALAAAACPSTTTTFAMGAVAAASSVTASLVVSSRGPLRAPVMAPRASSCTWCGCPARRRLAHVLL